MSTGASLSAAALAMLLASPSDESAAQQANTTEARGAILVQVTDTSINPLAAMLILPTLGLGAQLAEDGTVLVVNVPDGLYVISVQHQGYRSESEVLRVAGDTVQVEVALLPDQMPRTTPARAGAAIAPARLRSFIAWSSHVNPGTFVARSEIERRNARSMRSFLRRDPDIRVERAVDGTTILRSAMATGPQCADGMLVYVDGLAVRPADAPTRNLSTVRYWQASRQAQGTRPLDVGRRTGTGSVGLRWVAVTNGGLVQIAHEPASEAAEFAMRSLRVTDIDLIDMSSVVAIEIYSTPGSAPPELQEPGADCGVVSIWTMRV